MTPEPCPECKGRCCRDDLGYRVIHMGAEFYTHDCDDCWDGTYGVRSEPEPAPEPVRTAEEERADVVAWLNYARSYDAIASARFIASGGHVGWAKQGGSDGR